MYDQFVKRKMQKKNSQLHVNDCCSIRFTLIMYNIIIITTIEYRHEKDDKFINASACVTWSVRQCPSLRRSLD